MITKQHFQQAADIVQSIDEGSWVFERPAWASGPHYDASHTRWDEEDERTARDTRAVWTAEAFIRLFRAVNPRFDQARFLSACGLGPKPVSKRRTP